MKMSLESRGRDLHFWIVDGEVIVSKGISVVVERHDGGGFCCDCCCCSSFGF